MTITEKDFIQDTCKATPGFEYYPKKFTEINVSNLLDLLYKNEFYISKDNSPFYIHVKKKDLEATIFSSLKIIIKNITEEDAATKSFNTILKFANKILDG
jgi:ArsR family metal-binding transcriptional regulator